MNITLKKALDEDFDFAFEAKRQAMGPHVADKWGWDREIQLDIYRQKWNDKKWFLILLDGKQIGTISIQDEQGCTRIGEFYLIDNFRDKGIGTKILKDILADCDKKGREIVLEYLKWNPVGSLYKRHGFNVTHENDTHYFMAREPMSH